MKSIIAILFTISAFGQITEWNGTWNNGAPNIATVAVINAPYTVNAFQGIDCKELIVNAPMEIKPNGFVTIQDYLEVNSTLLRRSGGKIIPVSELFVSIGSTTIERATTLSGQFDYTYFSSPVQSVTIGNVFTTNWQMSHIARFNPALFYDIETVHNSIVIATVPDGQDDDGNAWVHVSSTYAMQPAKGIAAMCNSAGVHAVMFSGLINSGVIAIPMALSQNTAALNEDYNFVGNPYPSSIFAPNFINENLTNISGVLYYWTHAGSYSASSPGLAPYNYLPADYATYTLLGGTASSFGGNVPSDFIASEQGFLVEAEHPALLVFKPSFMAAGYPNSTIFFKSEEPKLIRLSTYNGEFFSQQLIGYAPGTDLGYNKGFDATESTSNIVTRFYSIQDWQHYKIQARGIFDISDIVQLGFSTAIAGTFTITVDDLQGIDNAFILDNGVPHSFPYTFTATSGQYNNRFELVFGTGLGISDHLQQKILVYPNPATDYVTIKGCFLKYELYDILGQLLKSGIDRTINLKDISSGIYFLKIDRKTIKVIKK